jgi:hypothetical protein
MAGHFGACCAVDFENRALSGTFGRALARLFDFKRAAHCALRDPGSRPSASTSNGRAARQGYQRRNMFSRIPHSVSGSTKIFLRDDDFWFAARCAIERALRSAPE